ncbi:MULTISPECIES: dihydrofolate reductase family protein [Bacteroidales]|jgi:5-amino-6-(5-phosphoribosylamino)uracil reductase|uniref:dihydrofolate reductase family protein n=1 Tax=Bacteroidales TaxID=171549 RepID=UPI00189A3B45|nr:dihydrofolate reductase family protein [Bacteroides cellulosilyticus]
MKPKIICHIMSSVDGRLLNNRWTEPFDGTPASDLLQVYAAVGRELGTDAWMFGKNTLRAAFSYKWGIDGHAVSSDSPAVFVGKRRSERMFIVADPEADIFFTSSVLRGDNMLVIVGRNATEEYLAHLREKQISYVIVSDAADLQAGLEAVGQEFGIRCISVQGGGILNGALLAEGLVDELSLVVYPGIDGLSGVPSIFEYVGGATDYPAAGQSLQLLSAEQREHGVMWLRYKFHKKLHK